jgi:predicted RNase H-like nuclease
VREIGEGVARVLEGARYFGVDLAWGQRNRTGLAVLDQTGRLVESASVRTDDEITDFVDRYPTDTLVAAVDAPLVVPNETGRRPCEALVGQHFARFGAGAYPANRGNSHFIRPRGAVIAERLGWDMDPSVRPADGRRACIEVYPHPAMVSLFSLEYVIPYKVKRGREVPELKDAYVRLLDDIEEACGGLLELSASRRWSELRATAASATRKYELNAIEDEIDAIFCAYLAFLWANKPEQMMVLGDYASGYIITPTPPPLNARAGRPTRRMVQPTPDQVGVSEDSLALAFRVAVPRLTAEESQLLAALAHAEM